MVRAIAAAAGVFASVLLSAGCTPHTSDKADSAPAGWPQGFEDFTIVWTGEKGVDLVTGPAVPVRAYIESFLLGQLTGESKYFYPGFTDAAEEKWRPGGSKAPQPWVGTMTNHLLSVDRSGADVTATGCMYTYNAASPHGQDKQGQDEFEAQAVPPGALDAGITAFEVKLSAPSEYSGPSDPQQGVSRTPFDNVFGGYKVTDYSGGYFTAPGADAVWPEYRQLTDQCVAKAPDPLDRRKFLSSNYPARSDFPTLPAAPGWPAKPAS